MQPIINQMSETFLLFVEIFVNLRSEFVKMRLPLDWNSALDSIDRGRDSIDRKWLQSCLVKMLMSALFSQSMCTFSFCISPWILTLNFISVFNIKNSYLWKNGTISSFPIYQSYSQPIMNKVFYLNELKKRNPWIFHKIVFDHLELPRPKTKTSRNSTLFFLGHPSKFSFAFN